MGNFTDWLVSAVGFLAWAIGIIAFLNSVLPLVSAVTRYLVKIS